MDSLFEAESAEILRRSLLSRLDSSRLKIVVLNAPAGFGKSTLARQIVRNAAVSAIVDCSDVQDDLDLAQRVLSALAVESPERTPSLIQIQIMLSDEAMAPPARAMLALEAWQIPTAASTLIFENAEDLLAAPEAHQFLVRLLASCPNRRSIIICSREDLRLHYTRFAAPHRVARLRATDLVFDADEMRQIFEPLSVEPSTIERIYAVSQGWPIAVFLLARFAEEGRVEKLLGQLDDVAFDDLHEYLAEQVLADLEADVFEALVAASFIPHATEGEIALATSADTVARFAAFERTSPFVTRSAEGEFMVHPLVSAILLLREGPSRSPLLQRVAAALEATDDLERSSELHFANGNHIEAARVLENILLGRYHAPSMRYARILAGLEPALVKQHPTLWACSALLRMYSSDSTEMLAETAKVWDGLDPNTLIDKRYYIFSLRVLFMSIVGQFEEALEFIEAVAPRSSLPQPPVSALHGYVLYLRATITARLGNLREAEDDLNHALPLVQSMDVMGSAVLMLLGADVARTRGDRALERELLERAIDATVPSGLSNVVAQRYAEATFGAWLAGEDAAFAHYGHELSQMVDEKSVLGLRYFANCVRNAFLGQPQPGDMPRWVLCGHLIAYGDAVDEEQAESHARSAVELTGGYSTPFLDALAFLALAAVCEGEERIALHNRAREAAGKLDSEPFREAVTDITSGRSHTGMLSAFVARRLRGRRERVAHRIEVDVLRGEVRAGGRERRLPNRELALLFALAIRRQTVPADSIADQLWPDLDEASGRNALYVCLHRLRARLEDEGAIVRTSDGFRLCDEARVDLWEIREAVSALRANRELGQADRPAMVALYEQLCSQRPAKTASWEWFRATELFIDELRAEVGLQLAKDALARRDFAAAIDVAQKLIQYDAFDEPANEVIITAYLKAGDRAAALRRYRQYCDYLRSEFESEPSEHMTALVRGSAGDPEEESAEAFGGRR